MVIFFFFFFFEKLNKLSIYRYIILGNLDNFSACKYCRKNDAIILGVTLLAVTKRVRFLEREREKKKRRCALARFFSTSSKPELGLILQRNDSILV